MMPTSTSLILRLLIFAKENPQITMLITAILITPPANTDWAPNTTFTEDALLLSIAHVLRRQPSENGTYPHFTDGKPGRKRLNNLLKFS